MLILTCTEVPIKGATYLLYRVLLYLTFLLISDGRITIARRAELLPAHAEPTRAAPGRPVQRDHNQQNHRPNRQASHCETMRAQSIGKWLLCNPLTRMSLF